MKKFLSATLAVLMIFSILPISAFANSIEALLPKANFTVIDNDESNLAPGVKMDELVLYNSSNQRVEMYVTTVDTTVDTVKVMANYMDNQNATFGMQTLSDQVAAMEANYEEPFKVVAGINASYYNVTTGQPTGAFVMEGKDASANGDGFAFFAVLKDGTYMIGAKGEYSKYKDQLKEAIGGYIHIVKDGAVVSGLDKTTLYPRQTLGLTADGKLILMTADGSQAPATVGLTIQEQAEVMLALGCVEAIHLDGGNSATFGAVREGTDKFVTVNSPSGGAERAVSNTLMIVSTAVADGTFDHAVIKSEFDYFAPKSKYTFSAFGVDATNANAEIPETAVWTLSDDRFGTISDGTFVSNGTLGQVDIQMSDNGEVIGSRTIEIVNPTSISFDAEEATVPYGKTAALTVNAMYGNFAMYSEADAYSFTINPATAGTLNGFQFTANNDEKIKNAVVTATYKFDDTVNTTSVTVKFGKGSEVLFDFEDGDISDWRGVDTIHEWVADENAKYPNAKYPILTPENFGNGIENTSTGVFLSSKENGGVTKSGDYALGLNINRLNAEGVGGWIYNYLFYTGDPMIWRDVANGKSAVRVGMWVNMPQNATNTAFRICRTFTKDSTGKLYTNYDYMMSDYDGKKVSYNTNYGVPESGWIYVYFDLTAYDFQSSLQYNPDESYAVNNGKGANGDYYPAFIQFINGTSADDDTMEELVLYIDDITLDYSEVTDDRDAPTISDVTVCSDTANFVALNGQTVTNNLLSFAAKVSDVSGNSNATGIDYTTAKIYVDGIDVSGKSSFKAANGNISISDIYLTNGKHTVAFVICDNQGNETRVTKEILVNGSATNAIVSVTGHNDSNSKPKAGSVYYVDIKASDAAAIEKITTVLKLNTANTFEYDNIVCADGVTATVNNNDLDNELSVAITHNGTLSGEVVLVSIPVRVWSWNEDITGVTADKQFASGQIPVIDIECKTVYGEVEYSDPTYNNYVCGFYDAIDVATELDNKTAWHAHTVIGVEDVDSTCTKEGYTGRTYCDVCASVIDWGTTVEATGHTYKLVDGKMVCDCGTVYVFTGIYTNKNGTYYLVNGVAQTGWQIVDDVWYLFDADTKLAVTGTYAYTDEITYEFDQSGKLVKGFWAKTLYGTRYYYGPGYYKNGWQTIDGKDYYFEKGYRVDGGYQLVYENQKYRNWYFFAEDGSCDKSLDIPDGFYTDRNGYAYSKNGEGLEGIYTIDGKVYCFDHKGYARNNGTYSGYLFKEDYAAYTGLLESNGQLYYYLNGKTGPCGLVEIDGDYYYSYWGGVIKTGKQYVDTTYCDLPAGNYEFGADGKMLNGIVDKDGTLYYYQDGKTGTYGLINLDGDYYYVYWGGVLKTGGKYYVDTTYCDLPAGNYEFGADGKMLNGVVEKNGTLYYYVNGKTATCGLFKDGDDYYYSYWGGVLKIGGKYYVDTTYCDLPVGNYTFGADGKMLNGIVDVDGTLYYYINGRTSTCGLFKIDGDYYYAYWGGVIKTSGKYYVDTTFCDLPVGNYTFGADGKMLNGPVEIDGTLYYYDKGKTGTCGLYEYNGEYYYSYWGGVLKTNGKYYVENSFCDLPVGNYEFDENGKMLNGFVEKNGELYYYINGATATCGLIEIDGDYYYVYWGGVVKTNGKYYVDNSFCDLPTGTYEFGEDGKMLNGIVEKDGALYYYENGRTPAPGLIELDGYYYFVDWGGKLITNQNFYVWETNGLTLKMNYTFNELGQIVL